MAKYKNVLNAALTIILWLITLILGFLDIDFTRKIIESIFARFWANEYWTAVLVQNIAMLVMALGFIVFMVLTTEYHRKHVGESGSWKLFGQTLGIEILIPVIAFFVA
jgi:uncharacterized membrane protein